jgi:hypothetical protein
MARATVHVVPNANFEGWIVCDESGRELGHFPTREGAELTAQTVARERRSDVVIHFPDGRTDRKTVAKVWIARLLGT